MSNLELFTQDYRRNYIASMMRIRIIREGAPDQHEMVSVTQESGLTVLRDSSEEPVCTIDGGRIAMLRFMNYEQVPLNASATVQRVRG